MSATITNTVVYDVEFVTQVYSNQTVPAGSAIGLTVTAPSGKYVLGGGGYGAGVAGVAQAGSFPGGSGPLPNIWSVIYINGGSSDVQITVTLCALCARVAGL